eukprot:520410-Lingulodinium_polyedra.AAC.1
MLATRIARAQLWHGLRPRAAPRGAHRTGHPEKQRNAGTQTGRGVERQRGSQHFGCAPPKL